MTVTWRELAHQLTRDLDAAGIDTPEVDARRIVEAASGCEGPDYHGVLDQAAPQRGVAALDQMQARRGQGEPLQYVIGRWGFRSLDLMVDARVLIPRPETEGIVGHALDALNAMGGGRRAVVDLGTGSGAIGLSIAVEHADAEVWATDRSSDALAVARANLAGVGRAGARVTLAEGSWFDALPEHLMGAIDLVVSNPPYVAAGEELPSVVSDWEPFDALVAGPDGLEAVEAVLVGSIRWLAPGGSVVVELAPHQAERAAGLADDLGFRAVSTETDLCGRQRALVAHRAP